ncbi:MAG: patatin-like phospholipase family protein [Anaeromyxobacteraceae bacterium]
MERTGLVLSGGGARAAYQIGALRAIQEIVGPGQLPFDVVTGLSAGAINAVGLATMADDFEAVIGRLTEVWSNLTPDQVFRTGTFRLAGIGSRWIRDLSAGGLLGSSGINYLLDPAPLRSLVTSVMPLGRMRRNLRAGRVHAVAVSATSYHTGAGVTFFEGSSEVKPWARSTRLGVRSRITIDHVMASAAIPVFFPPVRIGERFYGDGCVRMSHPLSPAIHLGARRIVAVTVKYLRPPHETRSREAEDGAPDPALSLSDIAGVLLNAVFLDSVDSDLERLDRINKTLALVPEDRRTPGDVELREIPVLVLRPSLDLGKLAKDEYLRFPRMLRFLLRGIGASSSGGADLLSYLAFEPFYLRRVMELGRSDTLARRDEVEAFLLGGEATRSRPRPRVVEPAG